MIIKFRAKNYIITLVLICIIYIFVTYLLTDSRDRLDNLQKLKIIEVAIHSNSNQQKCQMPNLPINSSEMLKFMKDEQLIDCDSEKDWVVCKDSICTIEKFDEDVTCEFIDIIRIDDFNIELSKPFRSQDKYILKNSDFVKVQCWINGQNSHWSGILTGIRSMRHLSNKNGKPPPVNVLMYGFDSLSRNAFIRKLPKTYEYLTKGLGGLVLEGYNIIGDGTPQAIIPILTGFTELELPETRKRKSGAQYVNTYPMIWYEYKQSGYVTAYNEDMPSVGIFTYRLNGFNEQPTDHYMHTYYLAIEPFLRSYKRLCVGSQPRHNVMLNYTKQFMNKYKNDRPAFSFSFHGELSHDSINLIGVADDDINSWLKSLKQSGILDNTILIMMSDHGNRFADVRNTLQGKFEERLPFFSFVFPDLFQQQYKTEYNNFKNNINRLTTPFDIHATLQHILKMQKFERRLEIPPIKRAISLFDQIPHNRTCSDAYIEPHWCACMNWKRIYDTKEREVVMAAHTLVDQINQLTNSNRDKCSLITLHEINWASKLAPNDNLIRFKQSKDLDGFLADFSSNTSIQSEMYQVKITVKPGKSIFEATILHNLVNNQYLLKPSDISRVNKYGRQASCIMESDPDLRKYCFCKTMITGMLRFSLN